MLGYGISSATRSIAKDVGGGDWQAGQMGDLAVAARL